jgi:hypothetical protein
VAVTVGVVLRLRGTFAEVELVSKRLAVLLLALRHCQHTARIAVNSCINHTRTGELQGRLTQGRGHTTLML